MHKLTHYSIALLIAFLFFGNTSRAQNLFDIDTIRTVEINFYDANWDALLDSLAMLNAGTGSGTERILAQVIIDGNPFDSCGVRYKGNSSMDTASNKNPFNIDLNWTIPGQRYLGKNKIKLANCFTDPSMVREALTYELANNYMDCPHGSFVKLYINGGYRGIYTNTESVDNEFLDTYYGSSSNPFFKCDPVSFDLAGGNSNLAYIADTMAYDTLYDMKSLYGLEELQTLCYNLEFNTANIEQYLDVDRALWFLAVSSAYVHNDGYSAFGHNYYVYKMSNGRWSIVLWDVNMSFGGLLWNGTNWLPLGITALQQQDPFLHEGNLIAKPLIGRLLSIPKYKRIYTAHFRTIMEETVANNLYLQRAEYMNALIDGDVQNEPFPEYTYAEFTDNIYNDVGVWTGLRPGLENLMAARGPYLNSLPEFQFAQPVISNINPSVAVPPAFSSVSITAEVSNATTVVLGYRNSHFDVFTKVQMFDDGLNNDGAAGDGIYGASVTVGGTDMEYYVFADNGIASKFSPVRAEYEFYVLTPEKGLVINELDAINVSTAIDQNFEYDDWIEFYNNSTTAISLNGYHLSDNENNLTKWAFPDTTIGAGEYLIVWADNDTLQAGLHANFVLSSLGESLFLSDNFGFVLDEVIFPAQLDNITWGRYGNGLGSFMYLYPTFAWTNTTPVGLEEQAMESLTVYPNPSSGITTIQFSGIVETTLRITDMTGHVVFEDRIINSDSYNFDASAYKAGMYFIITDTGNVIKFVKN
jgi:hypothetical protein